MKKYLFLVLMLAIGILSFGCGMNEPPAEPITDDDFSATVDTVEGKSLAEYLQEEYPLESDRVEIYSFLNAEPVAVITDKDDIKALQESVQFDKWIKYEHDQYEGIETVYVKFNDDTIIVTYDDIPYGILGTGPINVDMENMVMNVTNPEGHFDMSEEFLQTVQQMVEKYSK